MNLTTVIKQSGWWRRAEATPDRHYDPEEQISLADHLDAVHRNLRFLNTSADIHPYFRQLNGALTNMGLDPTAIADLLAPVALLHDIGKPREDKTAKGEHPISRRSVRMRHPILGLTAGLELIPESVCGRDTILALVEEHYTPYSWYRQYLRSGQSPLRGSWARLDGKIDPRGDGTGIVLLSVFKLADTDGHCDVQDVPWFFEHGNLRYLHEKGRWLPVPDAEAISRLASAGREQDPFPW